MLDFASGHELLDICKKRMLSISEAMIEREEDHRYTYDQMRLNLETMRAAIARGLTYDMQTLGGIGGGEAKLLALASNTLCGETVQKCVAAAMATVELSASMGCIVAAPTAGASGILPGTLLTVAEERGFSDGMIISGLLNAGAIGYLIARNATISGAEGGCQAETGAAAAMAASALVELCGGAPSQCLHAAAIALKNVMGQVCDPVAGLVECPCIKRNALGVVNALLCADMALAGIHSVIPFDEVVESMLKVGQSMPVQLRETALGGIAASPTGIAIKKRIFGE